METVENVVPSIEFWELALPALIGFSGFLVRFSVKRRWSGFFVFFLDIIAAVVIGTLASFVVGDFELSEKTEWFIIAVSAMIGPDILAGIMHTGHMFSHSPVTFVLRIVRVITHKPLTPQELKELAEWENNLQDKPPTERDE